MMTNSEKKRVYKALFIIVFAVTLGFSIINPFFSIYVKDLGAQGLLIALVFSGYFLSKIVFTPIVGRWSDKKSRRNYIIGGLIIYTLISVSYCSLPRNLVFLIFLRFMQGIGTALIRPIALSFVGDISTKSREGSYMGTFDVSFYSALAIGPILGGFINDWSGYRGIFLALLLLCFFSLVIALLTIPENRPASVKKVKHPFDYRKIFGNYTLQGLFGFIFTRSLSIVLISIFFPIYIYTRFHPSNLAIGVIVASGTILTPFLLRPFGILSDRLDRRWLVIIGGAVSGIFTLCLPLATDLWQLIILNMGIASFGALSLPASSAILVEEGNRHGLGLTMGLFHSIMNSGFFIGPFLGGILMDTIGLRPIFWAAGSLGVLGSIFFYLLCVPNFTEGILFVRKGER